MNSLISAANRVRSDATYSIRIDSIYNTGYENYIDRDFLQLVANRRTIMPSIYEGPSATSTANDSFNPNRPEGMYRESPSGFDYHLGMVEIANDLVRLCLIS